MPRRFRTPLGLALSCCLLAAVPLAARAPAAAVRAATDTHPNIIVINTDDQRFDSLYGCLTAAQQADVRPFPLPACPMPHVRDLLMAQGVTFEQSYVTTSMCCPSRTSLLTGDYSHHTGVLTNEKPTGGYQSFIKHQGSTLAVWLHDAGYRTALIGKYLNGYYGPEEPPGWDDWHAHYGSSSSSYYHYKLVDNGVIDAYTDDYNTTQIGQFATDFISTAPADQPFFLYFTPEAPHFPWQPLKGDGKKFQSMPLWRPPSFDEADVSDKPSYWQAKPLPTATAIANRDASFQNQLETLVELDRQVGNMVTALGPRLSNTMIVFTSDNGMTWGEHRDWNNKGCEFEECHGVPMVVRYDPLTAADPGRVDAVHPVLNIDIAPTVADLAGLTDAAGMDGRSFLSLLGPDPAPDWRTSMLNEDFGSLLPTTEAWPPSYKAIRTFPGDPAGAYKYVAECSRTDHDAFCQPQEFELYDEQADPYELCNLLAETGCGPAPPAGLVDELSERLAQYLADQPPVVAFDPEPPNTTLDPLTFHFSANGASRYRCSVDGSPLAECTSPFTPDGQTPGDHSLIVMGDGPGGTSAPTIRSWTVSTRFPPSPTFTQTPPDPSLPDGSFSFTDSEPADTFRCSLDGAAYAACTSPASVSGLSEGSHGFSVAARDGDGNVSPPATYTWTVKDDLTPPSLTMKTPSPDILLSSRNLSATWSATDSGSGLDHVDVFRRDGLGGPVTLVQSSLANSYSQSGTAAGTYCFHVTAYDHEGNSTTGPEPCAAVPLDDRDLQFGGTVTQVSSSSAIDGTLTDLTGAGADTRFTFTGRKVGVRFFKGPDAGKAYIYVGGTLVKTIDLFGSVRAFWWTLVVPNGFHTVKVAWSGKRDSLSTGTDVRVDGVAAIATGPPQPATP